MDPERLRMIVRNLESLVNCLKKEIRPTPTNLDLQYEEIKRYYSIYDRANFTQETYK
jgi:hypothetical protein